ncbi:MAG: hypothetical protein ACREX0_13260 [Noviherbaspirillum sp.]
MTGTQMMGKTAHTSETLAEVFCQLGKSGHKAVYVAVLQSIACLVHTEQLVAMRRDFDTCMSACTRA